MYVQTVAAMMTAFVTGKEVVLVSSGMQYRGYIMSIEREDGSGKSFNVKIGYSGELKTIYVRFKA